MTAENQLLPLTFALVEGENNERWSWFFCLVRKEVLGPDRSICIILDHHRDLLNGAKDPIDGYPPLILGGVFTILPQTFGRSNGVRKLSSNWRHCVKLRRKRNLRLDWKSWRRYSMMMQRLGCWSNGQRNLSDLLLLTRVVLDIG
jgi:hypothetical protein